MAEISVAETKSHLSELITNIFKPSPSPALLARLATVEQRQQHIATTTIAE